MAFYNICHDKNVHYDTMWSCGVHRCRECGSKWYSVLTPFPEAGEKYVAPYWVEGWSWCRVARPWRRLFSLK